MLNHCFREAVLASIVSFLASEIVAVRLSQLAVLLSPVVACGASPAACDGQEIGAEKTECSDVVL